MTWNNFIKLPLTRSLEIDSFRYEIGKCQVKFSIPSEILLNLWDLSFNPISVIMLIFFFFFFLNAFSEALNVFYKFSIVSGLLGLLLLEGSQEAATSSNFKFTDTWQHSQSNLFLSVEVLEICSNSFSSLALLPLKSLRKPPRMVIDF